MAIFNPKHINRVIDKVGNTVVISIKGAVEYDDWGNEYNQISSNISTIAISNDITGSEEFNTEGVLVPGDKIFFFKSPEVGLEAGNTILFSDDEFNMIKIISYVAEDTQQQYEVWGKKI